MKALNYLFATATLIFVSVANVNAESNVVIKTGLENICSKYAVRIQLDVNNVNTADKTVAVADYKPVLNINIYDFIQFKSSADVNANAVENI